LRKTEEKQTEPIGGADLYMPVRCRHSVNGQVAAEAAKSVLESHKVKSVEILEEATSVL
jgi:thymidine kinase